MVFGVWGLVAVLVLVQKRMFRLGVWLGAFVDCLLFGCWFRLPWLCCFCCLRLEAGTGARMGLGGFRVVGLEYETQAPCFAQEGGDWLGFYSSSGSLWGGSLFG